MEERVISKSQFLGGSRANPTSEFGSKLSLGLAEGGGEHIYYKVGAEDLLGQ